MGERALQAQDLDVLEMLSRQLGRDMLLAQVWMMQADFAYATSNYPSAIEKARQALSLAKSVEEEDVALDAYRVLPLALLRQGRLDEAMQHAEDGLQIARRLERRLEEGKILNSMGLIALEQKEPANAQAYFEQALNIARETSNRGLETKSLNNLGTSAGFVQGDYAAARKYYEQAYIIAQERGDRSLQSAALGNLGWAAGMQGDFDSARSSHEQALLLAREVGDLYHEAYTLVNLSAVAIHQKEARNAIRFAQQANELSSKIGDRPGAAWSLLYLGNAYLLDQNTALARDAFLEAVTIREELNQKNLSMEPIAGLIHVALELNDLTAVKNETEKILQHLENGGNFEGVEEPLRVYCACFEALQKLKDPRSETILQEAVKLLETQVSRLQDAEARQMFIQNVPCRRAINEAWQHLQRD
jgi:tetratricopeptide (TPR) repeat protein